MAERWQQWMPFHIDRFRGSPEVQAMDPAARCGYLYLLATAWQTEDCTLSADPIDLATASGLGDKVWEEHGPRILRKFTVIHGRLRNEVLFAEWLEAKTIFEKRSLAARRTNITRSMDGDRTVGVTVTERRPSRSADTQTLTGTGTSTEEKQIPSRDKREGGVSDPRQQAFRAAVMAYAKRMRVKLQWDGSEAKVLHRLLASLPEMSLAEFQECLAHRAHSPGTPHGERPRVWLPRILRYQQGPLDQYGKTMEAPRPQPGMLRPASCEDAGREGLAHEGLAALQTREEQDRQDALGYWRAVRGSPRYVAEAPRWVKQIVEAGTQEIGSRKQEVAKEARVQG